MRRTLIGLIATAALGSVSPAAFAADMTPPPPVTTWTGFYLGGGGGIGWADIDFNSRRCILEDGACNTDFDDHNDFHDNTNGNGIGIVQGGFDWELAPSFVIGLGADATFGSLLNNNRHNDDDFRDACDGCLFHNRFKTDGSTMVDVYGRAGFAPIESSLLVYGLFGWSWLDTNANFRVTDDEDNVLFHHDDNRSLNGFTVGAGAEWKFADWPLSLRAEYRFTDLDNFDNNGDFLCDVCETTTTHVKNDVDVNVQRVLFTLNWRFGGFGANGRPFAAESIQAMIRQR